MRFQVYVSLVNEGTEVWRPVSAEFIAPGKYRLHGQVPEGESWEFQPEQIVRCEEREFSGGARELVAVESCGP